MNFKQSLFKLKTKRTVASGFLLLALSLSADLANAQQYIHPNQAGSSGGNTSTPGQGNQVVISTRYGKVQPGKKVVQNYGGIFVSDKTGHNKFLVYGFTGRPDAAHPSHTTPQLMSDGNLYGVTFGGGENGVGAVYKVDLAANAASCDESVIHHNRINDGENPIGPGMQANLNELSDGKLYILYPQGGTDSLGQIIRMDKDGTNVEILRNFLNKSKTVNYSVAAATAAAASGAGHVDGGFPFGFVVEGADGKVYGSCLSGGVANQGNIWRMNKDGCDYEVIHLCLPGKGALTRPNGNVAQDKSGRIYFLGGSGGENNIGGLGSMNSDGSDFKILVHGSPDNGFSPYRGPLIIDDAVYGTFAKGSANKNNPSGTVWRYDIPTAVFTQLKIFTTSGTNKDGKNPEAGLAYDGEFLYGACREGGGPNMEGTLWRLKTDGSNFQVLHRFSPQPGPECEGAAALRAYNPSPERVTFANISTACAKTCLEDALSLKSLEFNLKSAGCSLNLDWIAENEVNVEKYEIEKSEDGVTYNSIAIVTAKGEAGHQSYNHIVAHEEGQNYYRLKVIDRDGSYVYSEVRKSQNACSDDYVNVYPNPTRVGKSISVKYRLQYEGDAIVQVYNSIGQLVQTVPMKVAKGIATEQNISLNAVAAGLYYVTIVTEDGSSLVKLQKLTVLNN